MKQIIFISCFLLFSLGGCQEKNAEVHNFKDSLSADMNNTRKFQSGYEEVNGIKLYYEIHGEGKPLVLIHGGGSTIETTFGRIIPALAGKYKVVAVELQNHGHSGFRDVPQTFEQDADDVAALVKKLGLNKASFFGFSNGGTTALQIALRHPDITGKLILASAAFKRNGMIPGFFDWMEKGTLDQMPGELKEAFLKINPDSAKLQMMFEKDRNRMIAFTDLDDKQIQSVKFPTLIINGDKDVVTPEHAVQIFRLLENGHLAILPGGHGRYLGEITTFRTGEQPWNEVLPMIDAFLAE